MASFRNVSEWGRANLDALEFSHEIDDANAPMEIVFIDVLRRSGEELRLEHSMHVGLSPRGLVDRLRLERPPGESEVVQAFFNRHGLVYERPDFTREAVEEDLPLLPAIEAAADEVFELFGIGPLPPIADIDAYRESLFVLVAGRPPIGFARVTEVDGQSHIEQMSVIPEQARKGVGRKLLLRTVDEARGRGYSRLTLSTFAEVPWNAPFYIKHGFKVVQHTTPGLDRLREREKMLKLNRFGTRVLLGMDL